jgi:hypothetical protein
VHARQEGTSLVLSELNGHPYQHCKAAAVTFQRVKHVLMKNPCGPFLAWPRKPPELEKFVQ